MSRNRDADILARRLERAAEVIPSVLNHLNEQRSQIALAGHSSGGRQRGTHADPVGQTIAKISTIDLHETEILDALASIKVGANILEQACASALRTRAARPERPTDDEPLCRGGDAATWGDRTCGELVLWNLTGNGHVSYDRDGLCARHRHACNTWNQRADDSNSRRKRRHNGQSAQVLASE